LILDELDNKTEKKGVNRAGELKRAAMPKDAPQRAKRQLQQKTCKCKKLAAMSPEQLTSHKLQRQVTEALGKCKKLAACHVSGTADRTQIAPTGEKITSTENLQV
jgi:hypothetical protein